jgi:hypothetical protein
MKLWTGTLRRPALMLWIREVSNSNYGRETVYQEDFVVWRRLCRKIPIRYLKFTYDHFHCTLFSRHYSPTCSHKVHATDSVVKWNMLHMYTYKQASLTTLIYV